MRYLSICSGIEAATAAWHPLGWQPVAFAQFDPEHNYRRGPDFPSAVLAHHYPDVPNWGDIQKFKDWPDATIDLLVGGTPCQSFSLAGLRKGLDDPRGNLTLVYLAIARRYRPRWILWENVAGVLSDKENAFGTFLGGLAELGYGFAYRVLDAQYVRIDGFGRAVPQRRRRVFVVGCLGDWRRAAAVLFDRESMLGNPPPRREAGKGIAGTLAARTGGGGYPDGGDGRHEQLIADVAPPIDASYGRLQGCSGQDLNHEHSHLVAFGGNNTSGPIEVATACRAKGGSGHMDFETETFVAHALRAEGFDASEDGTGRGTPIVPVRGSTHKSHWNGGPHPPLSQSSQTRMGGIGGSNQELFEQGGAGLVLGDAVCFDETQITSKDNRCQPQVGDPSHPLAAGARPPTIAFNARQDGVNCASPSQANSGALLRRVRDALGAEAFAEWGLGILDTLQPAEILRSALHGRELRQAAFSRRWVVHCALSREEGRAQGAVQSMREAAGERRAPQGWQPPQQLARELGAYLSEMPQPGAQAERFMRDLWVASEGLGILREALSAVQKARRPACSEGQSTLSSWRVRRLMVEECEFLQGFPRGYSLIPYLKKHAADGLRYRALGNSMAVNCMRWLGRRIHMVDDIGE